jgi:hypothetical protein
VKRLPHVTLFFLFLFIPVRQQTSMSAVAVVPDPMQSVLQRAFGKFPFEACIAVSPGTVETGSLITVTLRAQDVQEDGLHLHVYEFTQSASKKQRDVRKKGKYTNRRVQGAAVFEFRSTAMSPPPTSGAAYLMLSQSDQGVLTVVLDAWTVRVLEDTCKCFLTVVFAAGWGEGTSAKPQIAAKHVTVTVEPFLKVQQPKKLSIGKVQAPAKADGGSKRTHANQQSCKKVRSRRSSD